MAIIQQGMCIQCRTEEELETFIEIATVEGHGSPYHKNLYEYSGDYPKAFTVGYAGTKYPKDILNARIDDKFNSMTNVEASVLFRNHIISRRAKNVTN